jgi:hypothetical protein
LPAHSAEASFKDVGVVAPVLMVIGAGAELARSGAIEPDWVGRWANSFSLVPQGGATTHIRFPTERGGHGAGTLMTTVRYRTLRICHKTVVCCPMTVDAVRR